MKKGSPWIKSNGGTFRQVVMWRGEIEGMWDYRRNEGNDGKLDML